jgi:hypothetical protein
MALATGFALEDSTHGGELWWAEPAANPDAEWTLKPLSAIPTSHRLRWGDLDGTGRLALVDAPLLGYGAVAPDYRVGAPLTWFEMPEVLLRGHASASEPQGAIWANQFDNLANRRGHYETTGPEIWEETERKVDGFTCSVGTGGTLSGVGIALKERNRNVRICLSDCMGSGIYSWYARREFKPEGNSITEGIGNNRETENLKGFAPDGQYQITDAEMLPVLFRLVVEEGLVLGGSSGINVCGAIRLARELGPGHTIVTILADSGTRYQSKLFNPAFLREKSLPTPPWLERP